MHYLELPLLSVFIQMVKLNGVWPSYKNFRGRFPTSPTNNIICVPLTVRPSSKMHIIIARMRTIFSVNNMFDHEGFES